MRALQRYLPPGLALLAAIYVLAFAVLAAARLGYVHELEWEEGYSLQQVQRVAAGQSLYVAPSLDFVPFPYPPLYFLASAALARVFGEGFEPLRLVSILSTVASLAVLFAWTRRETGHAWCGAVAAGLFAGSYELSDCWFDVARVDALFLALTLAATWTVRFGSSARRQAAGGALFALGFLTKQTALLFALPLFAAAARLHGRRALVGAAVFAAVLGATTWIGARATDGWYAFHVFELLGRHEIVSEMVGGFWTGDVLGAAAPLFFTGSAFAFAAWRRGERGGAYLLVATATSIAAAWASRMHSGGHVNVVMPAHALMALSTGIALGRAFAGGGSRGGRLALGFLVALQFALLSYDPTERVPTPRDRTAGDALVARLARARGEVFVPSHPHLAQRAGKRTFAHWMGLADAMRADDALAQALGSEILDAVAGRRFELIVLDVPWTSLEILEDHYRLEAPPFDDPDVFWPVSGVPHRPELVYRRRGPAGGS